MNNKFRSTKAGVQICPFFSWTSENIEGLGHRENDVNLTICTHERNPNYHEGNCQEEWCPILKQWPNTETLLGDLQEIMCLNGEEPAGRGCGYGISEAGQLAMKKVIDTYLGIIK